MGFSKPKPPPGAPIPPDFAASFLGRDQQNMMRSAAGGTFLTGGIQPMLRSNGSQRKTLLGQ